MKWYFACNNLSKDYIPMIKAAVTSAKANTTLEPYFIYDGTPDELTNWLEQNNVKIIYHQISFYNQLQKQYSKDYYAFKIASGTYLRCDIPLLEKDDKYILYTDCDVIFQNNIDLTDFSNPKFFSCAPEVNQKDYKNFNAGVMIMNVKALKETHKEFTEFIIKNLKILKAWDQTAYQLFYKNKNTPLNLNFNHKPYWGINQNAHIIHYHGVKPSTFTNENFIKNMAYDHRKLYDLNPQSYNYYLNLFKKYFLDIQYDLSAIQKLNDGEYSINTPPKKSLKNRILNFIKRVH